MIFENVHSVFFRKNIFIQIMACLHLSLRHFAAKSRGRQCVGPIVPTLNQLSGLDLLCKVHKSVAPSAAQIEPDGQPLPAIVKLAQLALNVLLRHVVPQIPEIHRRLQRTASFALALCAVVLLTAVLLTPPIMARRRRIRVTAVSPITSSATTSIRTVIPFKTQ